MTIDGHEPLVLLVLLPFVLYVSIFIHELGHAVLGHAVGFVVTSLGIGTGRSFLTLAVGGKRIYFCHSNPLQGLTFCFFPQTSPSIRKMVPFLAGGIIANGLLALGAIALWRFFPSGSVIWLSIAALNGILALSSIIPIGMLVGNAELRSDGMLIMQAIRGRMFEVPHPVVIQSVAALRGLWESIGDHLILGANLQGAAICWAELGDSERAQSVYAELESLPRIEMPAYLARRSLVHLAVASGAGRLDEAMDSLDSALAHYHAAGDELGLRYVALGRAQVRILKGEIPAAVADLDCLTQDPLVQSDATLQIEILVARLSVSLVRSETNAVEENLARYKAARRERRSSARNLRVYRAVASFYAQQRDWVKAEPAYRAAVAAIYELAGAWADPSEQSHFMQLQSGLLTEAGDCLRALDKHEEAEQLIATHRTTASLQKDYVEAQLKRHRRLFRIGMQIMGVDVLFSLILIGLAALLGIEAGAPLFITAFAYVMFLIVAVSYLFFHLVAGRFVPSLRYSGGAVILILACLPWLTVMFLPFFFLLDPES